MNKICTVKTSGNYGKRNISNWLLIFMVRRAERCLPNLESNFVQYIGLTKDLLRLFIWLWMLTKYDIGATLRMILPRDQTLFLINNFTRTVYQVTNCVRNNHWCDYYIFLLESFLQLRFSGDLFYGLDCRKLLVMDGIVYMRLDINLCERLAFIISLTLYLPGYFYTLFVPEGKFAPYLKTDW